jgi:hypothetical protein
MKNKVTIQTLFIVIIAVLIFASCKTEKKAATKVYKIDSTAQKIDRGIVYSLPQTYLDITVKVLRQKHIPGPYHEYAEKLLGVSNVNHNKESTWEIENINIESHQEADHQEMYVIEPEGEFQFDFQQFSKKGWILPFFEYEDFPSSQYYKLRDHTDKVHFKDLSVKRFVGKETKTEYKRVWRDSLFAKIPVNKTYFVKKDHKEKAEEAASFIFMIREKRFELLTGMADFYPDGKALKHASSELDQLEEEYLELFLGKNITDTLTYTFQWLPEEKHKNEPEILFRFSKSKGLTFKETQSATPIWIEFKTQEFPKELSLFDELQSDEKGKFFFKVPEKAIISLKYAERLLYKKYLNIFQFGRTIRIPYRYMNNQSIIRYYRQNED